MGDLRDWSPERIIVSEERPSSSSPSSSFVSSTLPVISDEYWVTAEEVTQAIIAQVQPTIVSEERRKAVIDYVQRLIWNYLGCEVFPFGSVPLKTYLPDGDIDLTAFGGLNLEDALANEVCSVLEREDQNPASEFVVKDVQLIRAEVKLVKCLVQNIVVDISFNQIGGLCTLCFLEQVDRLIGKDHLFKRSIILIKAWCYYESRILGAHHGLISTYALETLVLYIFHLFNSSLNGPLAVLYKFLDYFSKFDWDNYCISLNGPIRVSALPEFVVEAPENGGSDLLLSNDFLKDCLEIFSVPSRGFEASSRTFPQKYLNIVDPLKENNNLGRSVSKGNFYRIRSAFTYGARKLGHILSQAEGNISDELRKFFSNTLDRHGSGQRPDVQNRSSVPIYSGFELKRSISGTDSFPEDQSVSGEELMSSSIINPNGKVDHDELEVHMSVNDGNYKGAVSSSNGTAVSEVRLSGDAIDLATSRLQASNGLSEYSSNLSPGNGEISYGIEESKHPQHSNFANKKVSSDEESSPVGLKQPQSKRNCTWALEDLYPGYPVQLTSIGAFKNSEASLLLLDLYGDYNSHLRNLQYGRGCCEYTVNAHVAPMSPTMHAQYLSNNSWDVMRRTVQFRKNMAPPVKTNGFIPRPVYSVNLHGAGFGMEEVPKPRGTGTYFPNTNHYRDRSWTGRGRNHASSRSPRGNGHVMTPPERKSPDRSCDRMQSNPHPSSGRVGSPELLYWRTHERSCERTQSNAHPSSGRVGSPELPCWRAPERMCNGVNGVADHLENTAELESFACPVISIPSTEESGKHEESVSPLAESLSSVHLEPQAKQTTASERDRILVQSYQLKDEGDFPPLSERPSKR